MRAARTVSSPPRHCDARAAASGCESGQALVLGVLFLGVLLIFMLTVPALAIGYALRAGTSSAADAAALACASSGVVSQYVDARGEVYGEVVSIDPVAGPEAGAQAWDRNVRWLSLQTVSFTAMPSGRDCMVSALVQAALPSLALLGRGRGTVRWTASAEAKAFITPS